MDALKSAGKAILRSPSIARHRARHQKLPENWTDTKESLLEGMVFHLKYLGMTLVEKPKGEDMAAAAIRRIITMARVSTKKFQKVVLTVTPRGISLQDAATGQMIENVSIYRISYCTTDKVQNKVFAYVAQNQSNETLECHAFLSPKKKMAQAVTLTVAQAFKVALDLWEAAKEDSGQSSPCSYSPAHQTRVSTTVESQTDSSYDSLQAHMSDTHTSKIRTSPGNLPCGSSSVLSPRDDEDDEEFNDLDEAFSRLAESRTQESSSTGTMTSDPRG
ncbi:low density lipoprotein receptor adapter protein 1-like isoform 2-T2 [Discoglossus pictus]